MSSSFNEIKKRNLERRRGEAIEEYDAIFAQLGTISDSAMRIRLQRQAKKLEEDIRELENEIAALALPAEHDITPPIILPPPPSDTPPAQQPSPEPTPTTTTDSPSPPPDNEASLNIIETAATFIKQWLSVQFLLWTAVSAVGFASNLGSLLDLSYCTRLGVITTLIFLGGAVILSVSLLPVFRSHYQMWDRGLTALMTAALTIALLASARQNCTSFSLLPIFASEPTVVLTNTPTPTNTTVAVASPSLTPTSVAFTPTITSDPNVPPPDPALGNAWTRPIDNMIMVYVPDGSFVMGSADGPSNERPPHNVTLNSFWLDQTEITNAQYTRCVTDGRCAASSFANRSPFDGDNYPVVGVDWHNAAAYCAWVGGRLPTEAEWEYAARGSDALDYPWGADAPNCARANYMGCVGGTSPVGNYPEGASWVGALDMAGNVWEWVNDWYSSNYYLNSPAENPQGPPETERKVLRGGAWTFDAQTIRAAYREADNPALVSASVGFRCVQELN